jgi:UDP-glucose 4-epimerase
VTGRRVLVTGGAGFIGSTLVRSLLDRGDAVVVLDNLFTGSRSNVPDEAEFVHADVCDPAVVADACEGVDTVFHQAAVRSVPRSVDDPGLTEQSNVMGTLTLLQAAAGHGVRRLVYASSSSVYGDSTAPVNREDAPTAPASPYAVSKLAAEHYCRVWTRLRGLSTVSLRYFNVFGPGQPPDSRYSAVFPAFVSALLEQRPPEVHWDGRQSRDFTYVSDVVRANILAAEAPGTVDGKVFNVGGGRPREIFSVLSAIARVLGTWIDPVWLPNRAGDIRRTRADVTRARALLGWEPQADWDLAVEATVEWYADRLRPVRSERS